MLNSIALRYSASKWAEIRSVLLTKLSSHLIVSSGEGPCHVFRKYWNLVNNLKNYIFYIAYFCSFDMLIIWRYQCSQLKNTIECNIYILIVVYRETLCFVEDFLLLLLFHIFHTGNGCFRSVILFYFFSYIQSMESMSKACSTFLG